MRLFKFRRSAGTALERCSMFIGVNFLKQFGQLEIDIVEAHLPLFDPSSDLNSGVAVLPPLGFGIELLLGGVGDLAD